MQDNDPLAVLAMEAPVFADDEAIAIVAQHYGLDGTVRTLVSERDQNFRLDTIDGSQYVLKIANAAEDPSVTDFQIRALIHIAQRVREEKIPLQAPAVVPTVDGQVSFTLKRAGHQHVVRLVTFLDGEPLAGRTPSAALARNAGACLANLGRALQGFEHPGSSHSLLWDLQQALQLRRLLEFVRDPAVAAAAAAALDDFERYALPVLADLRAQVVHSDLNPDNMLVDPHDHDQVAGVIDFGDMLHAPLIADVAIGCSYLRVADGNPLTLIAEFLAGYQRVTALTRPELDILFELIQARLAASITILEWRLAQRGSADPYLANLATGERTTGGFLQRLRELPRAHASQVFRQVCAVPGD